MLIGDLMLVMAGNPYYGAPIARSTLHGRFVVQVTNTVGAPTVVLSVSIEHRNRDDVAWATAGTFANITVDGTYSLGVTALKELVRYKFQFTAGAAADGMYVFAASPQWLRD